MTLNSISQDKDIQIKGQVHPRNFILTVVIIVILGCPFFYCLFVPATTGQSCPDPLSGHVPKKAEEIFLDKLVNAMTAQDYEFLSKISTPQGLIQLKELRPIATKNFEITFRDDLTGSYERELQFDSGAKVHLTFHGNWSCPDFIVTEQEVLDKIKLTDIDER